jgi:RNA polymerase sigma-70 factor (sigma-E family)
MGLLGRGRTRTEFERFVASHGKQLLRTGYLVTWDMSEAEDLVQECLLRVAKRWPKVRTMDHPDSYARRILVNLALDGAKGRGRRWSELEASDRSPQDTLADVRLAAMPVATGEAGAVEIRAELFEALGALSQRQRSMLVLRYFADLSEAQTADALGCSLGTVKSTTSRALERLREAMAEAEMDGPAGHSTDENEGAGR